LVVPALVVASVGVGPAGADPVSDKQAEAAALAKQIAAQGEKVSVLAEQVDQARLRSADVEAKVQAAEAQMAAADAKTAVVRNVLRQEAVASYVKGAGDEPHVDPSANALDLAVQNTYVASVASSQQDALDQYRATKLVLNDQKAQLALAKKAQDQALAQVTASQQAAAKAEADSEAQLAKVKGDLAQLVAQEQARQAAAESARVQAQLAARSGSSAASRSRSSSPTVEAPVSPGAAGAVEEARRQLGKPYQYGGSGPGSFDCSGLTAWAWGHAGVSLPHSAQAQYDGMPHVALSNLQPGDLVFYGSPVYHVGIYVGGGQMIEAAHTGTNVRYADIYRSDLVGASRP
jgi:cell wall-associated NlpC family hydrolase